MPDTPTARRRHILELLDTRRMVTVQELAEELDVSAMTVHRDLDRLAGAGYLAKTRGGATLPLPAASDPGTGDVCAMCGRAVSMRTAVIIQSPLRGRLCACCPHCGLALADLNQPADLMLVTEFLYCRMISAREAIYLVDSEVSLCCCPGILAFTNLQDAVRFQRGFGGEVMDVMRAQDQLRRRMSLPMRRELS